ncbi:hypothetical protein PENTCL1PPCAC_877, partial [Pristionchus entomophagus]
CKNTCLMMFWIVCSIIGMICKIVFAFLLGSLASFFSLMATPDQEWSSYDADLTLKMSEYAAKFPKVTKDDYKAAALYLWVMTALLIISIIFEAVLTHF